MHFADYGVAGESGAERGGNLACALTVQPKLTKKLDFLLGPGHIGLAYSSTPIRRRSWR
jgi:hypothetical protein